MRLVLAAPLSALSPVASPAMDFDYDEECLANKARNIQLLQGLGASIALKIPKVVKQPKQRASKKRKATPPSSDTDSEEEQKVSKRRKNARAARPPPKPVEDEKEASPERNGLRRSGRNRKKVDYSVDNFEKAPPQRASTQAGLRDRTSEPKMADKRKHDPSVASLTLQTDASLTSVIAGRSSERYLGYRLERGG